VKKDVQLKSPWFNPQSNQLCVSLHYYTHTTAGRESNTADLRIEYAGSDQSTLVGNLELSEVSFILNTHFNLA
jgi:hypothetical protein